MEIRRARPLDYALAETRIGRLLPNWITDVRDISFDLLSKVVGPAGPGADTSQPWPLPMSLDRMVQGVLGDATMGRLMVYMTRRFGTPNVGADLHKNLSGGWLLRTGLDDVFLRIQPRPGPTARSFQCWSLANRRLLTDVRPLERLVSRPSDGTRGWNDGPGHRSGSADRRPASGRAIRTTLLDLVRPVRVDNMLLGPSGMVPASNLADGGASAAPYSQASIIGFPPEMFDDMEAFVRFQGELSRLPREAIPSLLNEAARLAAAWAEDGVPQRIGRPGRR